MEADGKIRKNWAYGHSLVNQGGASGKKVAMLKDAECYFNKF